MATPKDTADTAPPPDDLLPVHVELLPEPVAAACGGEGGLVRYVDVTACAGLANLHVLPPFAVGNWRGTGQGFADLDGDGWEDLVITSKDGNNRVFLGSASGAFTERIEPALSGRIAGPLVLGDVDGDGWVDLYLAGRGEGWLFRNQAGASLALVPEGPSNDAAGMGASLADLDGDGHLELFVAQYRCLDCFAAELPTTAYSTDELFRWSSGWEDASHWLGEPFLRSGQGFVGTFADFDADGDPDLMLVNDKGMAGEDDPASYLKRNGYFQHLGNGPHGPSYLELARENGSDLRVDGMGIAVADLDRDGDLDAAITDEGPVALLLNDGAGAFVQAGPDWGLHEVISGWGIAFVDVDNDGDLDLAVAGQDSDRLYENVGGGFVERTQEAGLADQVVTYGLAAGDYDRDGRVDLLLGDDARSYRLMRNVGSAGRWIGIELRGRAGTAGGPSAIGARVRVTDSAGIVRTGEVQAGTSLGGGSALGVHFGLGSATAVSVSVDWPDGARSVFQGTTDRWQRATR